MNQVQHGYKGVNCKAYLDDILAFLTYTFKDHVKVTDKIIECLEENEIKLQD